MSRAAGRRRQATIGASLASLPFTLAHVVEDFAEGIAGRVGLSTGVGAFLVGGFLAVQALGLVLLALGRRAGWIVTSVVGLVWVAGAAIDHGPPLLAGRFGREPLSLVWLAGLVLGQALAAALAATGWRGAGRRGARSAPD